MKAVRMKAALLPLFFSTAAAKPCAGPYGGSVTPIDTTSTTAFTFVQDTPVTGTCAWTSDAPPSGPKQSLYQSSNAWGNFDAAGDATGGWNVLIGCNAIFTSSFSEFILEVDVDGSEDNDGLGLVFGWNGIDDHYQAIMMNDGSPNPAADGVGGPFMKITKRSKACAANMDATNSCQETLSYLNNAFAASNALRLPSRSTYTSMINFNHASGTIGAWPQAMPAPYAQEYPYTRGTNFDRSMRLTLIVSGGEATLTFSKDGVPVATRAPLPGDCVKSP